MNPEIKQKWIDALRSGEYEQGHFLLMENNHYCCLGVLADVVGELRIYGESPGVKNPGRGYIDAGHGVTDDYGLPQCIRDRVGLATFDTNHVMKMNDKDKATFPEIADYIQENL